MSAIVLDLSARRPGYDPGSDAGFGPGFGPGFGRDPELAHPAGVRVPFDGAEDCELLTPGIRREILSGSYARDMIGLLPGAVKPGDRVMVIGAGLGVLSAAISLGGLARHVLAFEANPELIPRIRRIARLNRAGEDGRAGIEAINGVPAHGETGLVPVFIGEDLRDSTLVPRTGDWREIRMAPLMEMNLVLTEERVSLIVCDVPEAAASLLPQADLRGVERILVRLPGPSTDCWHERSLRAGLAARGYAPAPHPRFPRAMLYRRSANEHACLCGGANTHAVHCPGNAADGAFPLLTPAGLGAQLPEPE